MATISTEFEQFYREKAANPKVEKTSPPTLEIAQVATVPTPPVLTI